MSSKTGGLGDNFYVGGYDVSGDVNSVDTISGGPAVLDFTTVDKSAVVRQGGLRSGEIDFTTFIESGGTASTTEKGLFSLPTSSTVVSYFRGTAVGNPAASLYGKQVNFDPARGTDGSLTAKVQSLSDGYGLEWGKQLTAGLRTDTAGTVGTSVNNGGATTYGGQAYLHVTSFSGTAATVTVEHSTDNSSYSTLLTFSTITAAPFSQRVATSAGTTVDQYVRATTAGTISSMTFAVEFVRNTTAVSF